MRTKAILLSKSGGVEALRVEGINAGEFVDIEKQAHQLHRESEGQDTITPLTNALFLKQLSKLKQNAGSSKSINLSGNSSSSGSLNRQTSANGSSGTVHEQLLQQPPTNATTATTTEARQTVPEAQRHPHNSSFRSSGKRTNHLLVTHLVPQSLATLLGSTNNSHYHHQHHQDASVTATGTTSLRSSPKLMHSLGESLHASNLAASFTFGKRNSIPGLKKALSVKYGGGGGGGDGYGEFASTDDELLGASASSGGGELLFARSLTLNQANKAAAAATAATATSGHRASINNTNEVFDAISHIIHSPDGKLNSDKELIDNLKLVVKHFEQTKKRQVDKSNCICRFFALLFVLFMCLFFLVFIRTLNSITGNFGAADTEAAAAAAVASLATSKGNHWMTPSHPSAATHASDSTDGAAAAAAAASSYTNELLFTLTRNLTSSFL